MSTCESGAPIYLSKPHFLDASDSLRSAVRGLSPPVRAAHDSWLGVEPLTGKVMDFQFRVQINARLAPVDAGPFRLEKYWPKAPTLIFPIGTGEQTSSVTPSQSAQFMHSVYTPLAIAVGLRWGGAALGLAGLVAALAATVRDVAARARERKARLARGENADDDGGTAINARDALDDPLLGGHDAAYTRVMGLN
jgi:hypothetical protein